MHHLRVDALNKGAEGGEELLRTVQSDGKGVRSNSLSRSEQFGIDPRAWRPIVTARAQV